MNLLLKVAVGIPFWAYAGGAIAYGVTRAVVGRRYDSRIPGGSGKVYSESQR